MGVPRQQVQHEVAIGVRPSDEIAGEVAKKDVTRDTYGWGRLNFNGRVILNAEWLSTMARFSIRTGNTGLSRFFKLIRNLLLMEVDQRGSPIRRLIPRRLETRKRRNAQTSGIAGGGGSTKLPSSTTHS